MHKDNTAATAPEEGANPGGGSGGEASVPTNVPVDLEALIQERDLLAAERAEFQDLLQRRQADYDNYRKRVEREKSEIRDYASMDAVTALLPILDDFERALQAAPAEGPIRDYATGVELIRQRLIDSLIRLGLESVSVESGTRFDPTIHNAVQREQRDDLPDQTVVEQYQRGYRFKGRLLRPAMVKVAVRS
jgi:molecular chaperone GrpE